MTTKSQSAKNSFTSGYNCAQSVLSSFNDILDRDVEDLRSVSAGFGGGMGKLQLSCGAVTGAFMVFSIYASKVTDDNNAAKDLSATMIRNFEERFKKQKGSLSCREILGVDMNSKEGQAEVSEKNLFGTVCVEAVETAVEIVEDILEQA